MTARVQERLTDRPATRVLNGPAAGQLVWSRSPRLAVLRVSPGYETIYYRRAGRGSRFWVLDPGRN